MLFVMSLRGGVSCLALIACKANMLDPGGVFSKSFALAELRSVGVGVSDPERTGLRSGDLLVRKSSKSTNLAVRRPLSGDRLSKESLKRLTLGLCIFWTLLFCARMMFLSGERGGGAGFVV